MRAALNGDSEWGIEREIGFKLIPKLLQVESRSDGLSLYVINVETGYWKIRVGMYRIDGDFMVLDLRNKLPRPSVISTVDVTRTEGGLRFLAVRREPVFR